MKKLIFVLLVFFAPFVLADDVTIQVQLPAGVLPSDVDHYEYSLECNGTPLPAVQTPADSYTYNGVPDGSCTGAALFRDVNGYASPLSVAVTVTTGSTLPQPTVIVIASPDQTLAEIRQACIDSPNCMVVDAQ